MSATNLDGAFGAIVDAAIHGAIVDTAPGAIVDAATCGAVVENMSGTSRKNMSSV